jgi:hypothetical protein
MSKVRSNGKDGLKITLTGLTTKLPRLTLDLHTTLPLFNLISLEITDLVCPSLLATFVVRKNGKDGLKTTLTGLKTKKVLLTLDLHTTLPFFNLILLELKVLLCLNFLVLSKVRKIGKDGPKTTLTGLITKLRLLTLDSLTLLPSFNLATRERCLMSKLLLP